MAKPNSRFNNFKYNSRLSHRVSHSTLAKGHSHNINLARKYPCIGKRNFKASFKGGNSPSKIFQNGLLQPPFPCTKERRRLTPSYRFKQSKSIYLKRTFSDGKHSVSQTTTESKRLYDQTGPQGRLPNSGHSRGLSTIPSVYIEGPNIPVSSPAIRVVHGPKNIHETSQTCHSVPSYAEHSAPHLSGRYSNCRFKYNSLGFIINLEKSALNPSQVMEFLGLVDSSSMKFYLPPPKVTKT